MHSLIYCAIFGALCILHVTGTAMSPQTQKTIENILENAGDKTMFDIYRAIDNVVATMDATTQAEHAKWKADVKKETKDRETAMKAAMPLLSGPAQARLVRIIMVQQSNELTQNEKSELLRRIQSDMDTSVRKELLAKLPEKTLFTLIV